MVISEDPDTHTYCRVFGSGAVTTFFYYLGLSRLEFEYPTFRLWDEHSNPLRHHCGFFFSNNAFQTIQNCFHWNFLTRVKPYWFYFKWLDILKFSGWLRRCLRFLLKSGSPPSIIIRFFHYIIKKSIYINEIVIDFYFGSTWLHGSGQVLVVIRPPCSHDKTSSKVNSYITSCN